MVDSNVAYRKLGEKNLVQDAPARSMGAMEGQQPIVFLVPRRQSLQLRRICRAMAKKRPPISPAIHAKLKAARIARLATLDAEGRPHVIPVCFVWSGSVFYSAIDRKPKRVAPTRLARLKNIQETPHVALLIDQYDEDWTRLWYVLVRGEAKMVSSLAERKRAIQRLRAKYPQYDANMLADDAPVLRITPVRVTAWGKL